MPLLPRNYSFQLRIFLQSEPATAGNPGECGGGKHAFRDGKSDGFQIDRGRLAVLPLLELIRDFWCSLKSFRSGAFDRQTCTNTSFDLSSG